MSRRSLSPGENEIIAGSEGAGDRENPLSLKAMKRDGNGSEEKDDVTKMEIVQEVINFDCRDNTGDDEQMDEQVQSAETAEPCVQTSTTTNDEESEAQLEGKTTEIQNVVHGDSPVTEGAEVHSDSSKPADCISLIASEQTLVREDGVTEIEDDTPRSSDERLQKIMVMLRERKDDLSSSNLKEYGHFDSLVSSFESAGDLLADYKDTVGCLRDKLHQVRLVMSEMSDVLEKKLAEEGLRSWLPKSTPDTSGRSLVNIKRLPIGDKLNNLCLI